MLEIGIDSFAAIFPDAATEKPPSATDRMADLLLEKIKVANRFRLDVFDIGEHHRADFLDSALAIILAAAAARARRIVAAVALTAAPIAVQAQTATDIGRAPTLTIERYQEDWSYLADPAHRAGHWTERFKYIPLNEDGSVHLTTGLEARSRYESYRNVDWGAAPDDSYVWQRLVPYADLHLGRVRVFAQPILSTVSGLDRAEGPVDTTGTDTLQAFVEVEALTVPGASLRVSAGRKLMAFGGGRIIDNRYGPGIPQAFETLQATLQATNREVTAFHARPVDTMPGDFDDRASREETVWGAYATQQQTSTNATGIDIYYLGFDNRRAVFDQGTGSLEVHMLGTRLFGDTGTWFWNVEGGVQRGRFAGGDMAAWAVGSETGYRFRDVRLRPEITIAADIISGDNDPDDSKLGTFHPFFPRGKYFGGLSPIGPRNLIHVRPTVAVHPHQDLAVSLTGAAFWRESTNDGIYAIPGILVRSGRESDARFIGTQLELAVAWQATAELNLSMSFSAFEAGRFIRETGPAQTLSMVSAAVNFRF